MKPVSAIDPTEALIDSHDKAVEALTRLPENHPQLNPWRNWSQSLFAGQPWLDQFDQSMTIAYARMAIRNGVLSDKPRSYHNELHINDLLSRIIYCAKKAPDQINLPGLAILSFFAATHDLRQAEPPKSAEDDSLVGSNEMASYQEASRIIDLTGDSELWTGHNKSLLKTMIEGSTFGSGGKRSKNFFQGNLAKHLLSQHQLASQRDEQLVLLACDIDTANVSLPIEQFAASGIHIFDELVSHHNAEISAWQFFSEQQKIYFFEQQAFHADLSKQLFQPYKEQNTSSLLRLCEAIARRSPSTPADEIKQHFIKHALVLSEEQ